MSTTNKNRQPPMDSTQVMLQKNDRIREKHIREVRRIGTEAQRSNEDLDKQIEDLQKEIQDLHAYKTVYRDNSLIQIDEKRVKPTYSTQEQLPAQQRNTPSALKKPKTKQQSTISTSDPFRVRSCLLDVDFKTKETKQPSPLQNTEPTVSVRKRLKRSSTAVATRTGGSAEYQSLLPGKCTSYYSIRKFYEQEKDKLLQKWSPEERRKNIVQWILHNNTVPHFSAIRRATTSAIFRDFRRYKSDTDDTSSEHLSLPTIANDESSSVTSKT